MPLNRGPAWVASDDRLGGRLTKFTPGEDSRKMRKLSPLNIVDTKPFEQEAPIDGELEAVRTLGAKLFAFECGKPLDPEMFGRVMAGFA